MTEIRRVSRDSHARDAHQQLGHGPLLHSPFSTVTAAFYHFATCYPDSVAVYDMSGPPRELTYRKLAERAQQLAQELRHRGVLPGQRIPLIVKRGLEMVVGIWAILSCGAQYVPLDGGVVPEETIRRVLAEAQGEVVLCLSSTKHRIAGLERGRRVILIDESISQVERGVTPQYIDLSTPDSGCYVIYTSGELTLLLLNVPN